MSGQGPSAAVAGEIGEFLDAALAEMPDLPLTRAMRYACAGGKRLRGFLVMEAARLHGAPRDGALHAAAAIEAMHAYSLVHDDLPAMDDDDLRRGQPTVHVAWDEATAILVGDGLQSLAFELLARGGCHPDPRVRLTLIRSLAEAAGARGMVLGQAQDIAAESAREPLSLEAVIDLQNNKTGALIVWSASAGACLGGADPAPMRRYAQALGLAFQIADDLLDATGSAEKAGKRLRKDADAGKATFLSHLGEEGARARARALVEEAEAALVPYGADGGALRALARFVIHRQS